MRSLLDLQPTILEWRRCPGHPPSFDLHAGDGLVATVAFLDPMASLARFQTAEGAYTVRHLGLLAPVVTLKEEGAYANLAVFHPHVLRHGKLEFLDGSRSDWVWLHGTHPGGAFLDAEGMPMVRLHATRSLDTAQAPGTSMGTVELGPPPAKHWRQALLAALGWYLLMYDQLHEVPVKAGELSLRM